MIATLDFKSKFLDYYTQVSLILPKRSDSEWPADYYRRNKRYKVLWLLHGANCDHTMWIRRSNIETYARSRDLICVMPGVGNTNYSKWPVPMDGLDSHRYITEELMPIVHNWLPGSAAREDNFVCGFSMGGCGAIKLAALHPDLFGGAAALSGTPVDLRSTSDDPDIQWWQMMADGPVGSREAALAGEDNVWDLLPKVKDELPPLYVSCGTEDTVYGEVFLGFKRYAEELGLNATFSETPGLAHDWDFWDPELLRVMDFFGL